jgi:predicted transcriptional regulator
LAKEVTITARIDAELAARLSRLSELEGRSKSWLVGEALKSYLEAELAFIEAVEEGRRDLREGRTLSHEEVVAAFRSHSKAAE